MMDATQTTFQKYPAYKDSGVEWLGEIPVHWEVKRLKYVGRIKSGDSIVNNEINETGTYEVYGGNGLMGYVEKYNVDGEKIIIGRVGALCGNIRYSNIKRWISDNALIFNLNRYENYKFISIMLEAANLNNLNTSNAQPLITGTKVLNFQIPYPPLPEQTAIAAFLDDKTAKIDRAIAQKEKMIALLKERKQIIIQHAVTKGLDPNANMKDSGVEWLGEIPSHWEVKRLKFLVKRAFSGGTPSTDKLEYWDGGIPWVSSVDVKTDYLSNTHREISEKGLIQSSSSIAPKGSIVFVTRSGILQHTFALSILNKEMAINQDIKCLIFSLQISELYFLRLIQGNNSRILVETRQQAATVESISMNSFFNLPIPVPPLHEQTAIVAHIEAQSDKIDRAISLQEQQIGKLKELKATLIDGAVTGKIKVSEL